VAAVPGQRIFSVRDVIYTWGDVVLASILWGDWEALEREVRGGLACLKRLEEHEDEEEVLPEDEVNSAAEEFRYVRDLVAAEDMEAWLEKRGLTAADWLDYIQRSLLIKKWADDLEAIQQEYPVDQDEVDEVMLCDAICGGRAADWAASLAARAAASTWIAEEAPDGTDALADEHVRPLADALRAKMATRDLPGFLDDVEPERLNALARLEAAWREFSARQVTPQAIRDQIAANPLDWIRFSLRSVSLQDQDAAREAALCIRQDGLDPAEVAAESGGEFTEGDWYLEEADPALRDHLLGAQEGEVLGPLRLNDGFVVVSVRAKRPPSEDDPALVARASQVLLDRAVRREVESRVRWKEPL